MYSNSTSNRPRVRGGVDIAVFTVDLSPRRFPTDTNKRIGEPGIESNAYYRNNDDDWTNPEISNDVVCRLSLSDAEKYLKNISLKKT